MSLSRGEGGPRARCALRLPGGARNAALVLALALGAVGCRAEEAGPAPYAELSVKAFRVAPLPVTRGATVTFELEGQGLLLGRILQGETVVYSFVNADNDKLLDQFLAVSDELPVLRVTGVEGGGATAMPEPFGGRVPDAGFSNDDPCGVRGWWAASLPLAETMGPPRCDAMFQGIARERAVRMHIDPARKTATSSVSRRGVLGSQDLETCRFEGDLNPPRVLFQLDVMRAVGRGRMRYTAQLDWDPSSASTCEAIYEGVIARE